MIPVHDANPEWNPWANDQRMLSLYRRRSRGEELEMTCAAQAAELLMDRIRPGETLLDAGCAGGHYFRSFAQRGVTVEYHGLDYTPAHIQIARQELAPRFGLPEDRFVLGYIEDLNQEFDNILCFNTLTNAPHYALPLERLLRCTRRRLLLRESLGPQLVIRYTPDPYLDPGKTHICVYHNTYPFDEVVSFIKGFGFVVTNVPDRRTGGKPEMVVDIPHHWRILLAERNG